MNTFQAISKIHLNTRYGKRSKLPRFTLSVLLGTDVPELVKLLNDNGQETGLNSDGGEARDVLVVMRTQQEVQQRVEEQLGCDIHFGTP